MNCIDTFFSNLVSLLYPKQCAGCGSDLPQDSPLLCPRCLHDLPLTGFHRYPENPVEKIFRGRIAVSTATAHVYFSKRSVMQNLLHRLKYDNDREIGLYFGRRMGEILAGSERHKGIGALIPLPLNIKKEKKRGFNQSAVICEGMAEKMLIPVYKDVVARRKDTPTQTRKTRMERWKNMEGGFRLCHEAAVQDMHVLLVDDVITTGATLEACGTELLKIKNLKLSIAALAYTTL